MSISKARSKTLRYSSAVQALLTDICANESAALRALALIGADTVGQDLKPVLPDLRLTRCADLPLEIHTTLQQIHQRAAEQATFLPSMQEANESSFETPVPASPEIHPQNKRQTFVATSDNTRSESSTPDAGPLADLGVESG